MIQNIEIQTTDGVCDASLFQPSGSGPWPAVIFCMDAVGPRPNLIAMAESLSSYGYVVLLPNIFYREKKAPIVTGVKFPVSVENIPEVLKQIMPLVEKFDPNAALRDMSVFINYLNTLDQVHPGKFGIFGYCMGGALAIRTAAAFPERFAAALSFHAGGLVSEDASSVHRLLPQLKAALYVAHADQDPHMNAEQIKKFGEAASTLTIPHEVELYEGAHHHFTMADLPAYDEKASTKHWNKLLGLLQNTLGSK